MQRPSYSYKSFHPTAKSSPEAIRTWLTCDLKGSFFSGHTDHGVSPATVRLPLDRPHMQSFSIAGSASDTVSTLSDGSAFADQSFLSDVDVGTLVNQRPRVLHLNVNRDRFLFEESVESCWSIGVTLSDGLPMSLSWGTGTGLAVGHVVVVVGANRSDQRMQIHIDVDDGCPQLWPILYQTKHCSQNIWSQTWY